jgi:hypothetical protein
LAWFNILFLKGAISANRGDYSVIL